jgi:SMP-30/gluconolaconase/LRE-like protein
MKTVARLALIAAVVGVAVRSQIPPSETLSLADSKLFRAEVARIERMLETAGDKCTVEYALARTWASGGQYQDAMNALRTAAALKVGLDPSNDAIFAKLRGTNEFERLLRQIRDDTPPIVNRRLAFTIEESDLFPEGIAYDSRRKEFFLGSTHKRKIVRCTPAGECQPLTKENQDGMGEILGLKTDPTNGSVWAASNGSVESGLFHYAVPSGKLIRKYSLNRKPDGHLFNDLVINSRGDVFVTDTQAGTVYWVSRATDRLDVLIPSRKVTAANGIARSADGKKLYVAGFPEGITVVDLTSKSFHAIGHPADLCLATIDGLAFSNGDLVAIQNGVRAHRVVRYRLTRDLNNIDRFEVLERRNPLFEGITSGAIANGAFYFMANTQLDKVVDGRLRPGALLNPIKILELKLTP